MTSAHGRAWTLCCGVWDGVCECGGASLPLAGWARDRDSPCSDALGSSCREWEWEEPRAPTLLKPPLARGHAKSPGSAAGRGSPLCPPTKARLICGWAEVQTPQYHHTGIWEGKLRENLSLRMWERTERRDDSESCFQSVTDSPLLLFICL